MDIKLNKETLFVISTLERRGYLAYVVGDFVRDSLLNVIPNDMDIVTDATLSEVRNLFSEYKIVDYKKKTLSLGVIINNFYIECRLKSYYFGCNGLNNYFLLCVFFPTF